MTSAYNPFRVCDYRPPTMFKSKNAVDNKDASIVENHGLLKYPNLLNL